MEYATKHDRGELIDLISSNEIHPTDIESKTDKMYRIGDKDNSKAFITVQCDEKGHVLSAYCIKHTEQKPKYLKFVDPTDASFVNDVCEQKLKGQINEKTKIERFLEVHQLTQNVQNAKKSR